MKVMAHWWEITALTMFCRNFMNKERISRLGNSSMTVSVTTDFTWKKVTWKSVAQSFDRSGKSDFFVLKRRNIDT